MYHPALVRAALLDRYDGFRVIDLDETPRFLSGGPDIGGKSENGGGVERCAGIGRLDRLLGGEDREAGAARRGRHGWAQLVLDNENGDSAEGYMERAGEKRGPGRSIELADPGRHPWTVGPSGGDQNDRSGLNPFRERFRSGENKGGAHLLPGSPVQDPDDTAAVDVEGDETIDIFSKRIEICGTFHVSWVKIKEQLQYSWW